MINNKGFHLKVTGRVQGVGYRYYCRNVAGSMKLKGYVMNLPDGSVEIEVFGEDKKINEFIKEIRRLDMGFFVDEVQIENIPQDKKYHDFEIKFYSE